MTSKNTDSAAKPKRRTFSAAYMLRIVAEHDACTTGTFWQVTDLTKLQTDLLARLGIPRPKQVLDLQPTSR
ncbi:hypothetical protein GCM10027590_32880 [Nocardiopsis nanhaiensis]